MDEKKELWKYAYAWASFRDVIAFANRTIEIFNQSNDLIIKALTYSIITSYARPFKQKPSLRLSDSIVKDTNRECHEFLIELRDKVITHQDPVTTKTGFGNFNQVTMYYSGKYDWQFTTLHPRITPDKCSEIIKLASGLLEICDEKIGSIFESICISEELENGNYRIEPETDTGDSKFVFKKLET